MGQVLAHSEPISSELKIIQPFKQRHFSGVVMGT